MIDMHSHILPGIDDGAKNIEVTLEMLRQAVSDGTKKIVATPHYCMEYAEEPYSSVKEIVQKLRILANKEKIDIEIFHGQEVYYSSEILKYFKNGDIGTINDSRYILIEFPMRQFDEDVFDILYELQVRGLKPIIAHPERYSKVIQNPEYVNRFIDEDMLLQMNVGSIFGKFGNSVMRTSEILAKNNIYNFIGSDAHNTDKRTTKISEIKTVINADYMKFINESSENVLNNKEVEFVGEKIKAKKTFFSFLKK